MSLHTVSLSAGPSSAASDTALSNTTTTGAFNYQTGNQNSLSDTIKSAMPFLAIGVLIWLMKRK